MITRHNYVNGRRQQSAPSETFESSDPARIPDTHVTVKPATTREEARRAVADDCDDGLPSSVLTDDAARVFRFVDVVETGTAHVNSLAAGGEAHTPSGGVKTTGDREQASAAPGFHPELNVALVDDTGREREGNLHR